MSWIPSVVRAWGQRMGSAPPGDCRTLQNAGGGCLSAGSPMTHHSWHTAVGGVMWTGLGTSVGNA